MLTVGRVPLNFGRGWEQEDVEGSAAPFMKKAHSQASLLFYESASFPALDSAIFGTQRGTWITGYCSSRPLAIPTTGNRRWCKVQTRTAREFMACRSNPMSAVLIRWKFRAYLVAEPSLVKQNATGMQSLDSSARAYNYLKSVNITQTSSNTK